MSSKGMQFHIWNEKTLRDRCVEVGECLIWDQGRNSQGYPQARINGKSGQMVRRWVYTHLLGGEMLPRHVVVTTCGDRACCSPSHVRLMSHSKRMELTYKQGKRLSPSEMAKRQRRFVSDGHVVLNMSIAREIRNRQSESPGDLAKEYGVTDRHIRSIWLGDAWKEVNGSSVFAWRP